MLSLTIQLDRRGVSTLSHARQKIGLVQSFRTPPENPTVWVTVEPTQNIVLSWNSTLSVYASNTSPSIGQAIVIGTSFQAVPSGIYRYAQGLIKQARGHVGSDEYKITNADRGASAITAGVVRGVKGAGTPDGLPMIAEAIPHNQFGLYSVTSSLDVFASSGISNSLVISPSMLSTSPTRTTITEALTVDFGRNNSQTIHYDSRLNAFAMGPLPTSAEAVRARP